MHAFLVKFILEIDHIDHIASSTLVYQTSTTPLFMKIKQIMNSGETQSILEMVLIKNSLIMSVVIDVTSEAL